MSTSTIIKCQRYFSVNGIPSTKSLTLISVNGKLKCQRVLLSSVNDILVSTAYHQRNRWHFNGQLKCQRVLLSSVNEYYYKVSTVNSSVNEHYYQVSTTYHQRNRWHLQVSTSTIIKCQRVLLSSVNGNTQVSKKKKTKNFF